MALSSIQPRQLSRGLAAAAVAGALYVASRRRASGPPPSLIDWEKVRAIASMIARRDARSYADVRPEYAEMVARSQRLIATYAREPLPVGTDHVYVFDRVQWLDANIAAFRELFEPVERINGSLLAGRRLLANLSRREDSVFVDQPHLNPICD